MDRRIASAAVLLRGLLHPYSLLDFTWGVLQSTAGLGLALIAILRGAGLHRVKGKCLVIYDVSFMPERSGVSLGPFLLGGRGFHAWTHEYGHTHQSRMLGPLYLIVIGIPSLLSASLRPAKHHRLYAERWAEAWAPRGDQALAFQDIGASQSV